MKTAVSKVLLRKAYSRAFSGCSCFQPGVRSDVKNRLENSELFYLGVGRCPAAAHRAVLHALTLSTVDLLLSVGLHLYPSTCKAEAGQDYTARPHLKRTRVTQVNKEIQKS